MNLNFVPYKRAKRSINKTRCSYLLEICSFCVDKLLRVIFGRVVLLPEGLDHYDTFILENCICICMYIMDYRSEVLNEYSRYVLIR